MNCFGRLLVAKIPVKKEDGATLPLAYFGGTRRILSLFVSHQCFGTFCCIVDDVGSLNVILNDTGGKVCFTEGLITCALKPMSALKMKGGDLLGDGRSSPTLRMYMQDPARLQSSNATFTHGMASKELRMNLQDPDRMQSSNATFTPDSIVVHADRLMKFKGLKLSLLLQRNKFLQSEMDIASLRGIVEDGHDRINDLKLESK
jgi:hypothetical protein